MVNYTSIPCDAPMPQRYLFRHGNGRGWRNCMLQVGMVQSLPWGWGMGRGEVLWRFLALQRFGLKSSRLREASMSVTSEPSCSQHSAALAYVCQPQVAPATHKQNYNTRENNSYPSGKKEDQFITRYIIQPK